jgi:uncharacterized protein (DUF1330 family)
MAHLAPTDAQIEQFRELMREGPIHMLNLVRLRARAAYADGHEASGSEAYHAYARESAPVLERVGGKQIWVGRFEMTVVGPSAERWDRVFIVEYPSDAAFAALMRDPAYREALTHHQAAVEDSRVIRLEPREPGAHFGEWG